jgi:SAM-dependent methyltransferase
MLNLLNGMWAARAIQTAAQLGIADLLVDGPRRVHELAETTGTHTHSLYRLLRALASLAIFTELAPGTFAQTELSETLRSRHAGSVRAMALMMGGVWEWNAWRELDYSVRTGQPAFDYVYGMDLWHYYRNENPQAGKIFNEAMSDVSNVVCALVPRFYDFSGFHTILDVGGGGGTLLTALLNAFPHLQGLVFEQPHVLEQAREQIAAAHLTERCTALGGDFFEAVPCGADVCLLKSVLHDWDDENCVRILKNCRRALPPDGRLLVIDAVIGDEKGGGTFAKLLDVQMLIEQRGRERTAAEFQTLLAAAGFSLNRVIRLPTIQDLIEAVPVEETISESAF